MRVNVKFTSFAYHVSYLVYFKLKIIPKILPKSFSQAITKIKTWWVEWRNFEPTFCEKNYELRYFSACWCNLFFSISNKVNIRLLNLKIQNFYQRESFDWFFDSNWKPDGEVLKKIEIRKTQHKGVGSKLRRCGTTNQIVDGSDFKLSRFDRQYNPISIPTTILYQFRYKFDLFLIKVDCFWSLLDWKIKKVD